MITRCKIFDKYTEQKSVASEIQWNYEEFLQKKKQNNSTEIIKQFQKENPISGKALLSAILKGSCVSKISIKSEVLFIFIILSFRNSYFKGTPQAALSLAQHISGNKLQIKTCHIYRNTSQYVIKLFVCIILEAFSNEAWFDLNS